MQNISHTGDYIAEYNIITKVLDVSNSYLHLCLTIVIIIITILNKNKSGGRLYLTVYLN